MSLVISRLRCGSGSEDSKPHRSSPDFARCRAVVRTAGRHPSCSRLDFERGRRKREIQKNVRPSEAVHGNVTPTISAGGFAISKARQTTVLSLATLRRLRFPLDGAAGSDQAIDVSARTALAALGLAAGTLARNDVDLRSRCLLFAETAPTWELLDRPAAPPTAFDLDTDGALQLLAEAIEEAKGAGLPWAGQIDLAPSAELVELGQRSQELASKQGSEQD